jgi:hypothetical protein
MDWFFVNVRARFFISFSIEKNPVKMLFQLGLTEPWEDRFPRLKKTG